MKIIHINRRHKKKKEKTITLSNYIKNKYDNNKYSGSEKRQLNNSTNSYIKKRKLNKRNLSLKKRKSNKNNIKHKDCIKKCMLFFFICIFLIFFILFITNKMFIKGHLNHIYSYYFNNNNNTKLEIDNKNKIIIMIFAGRKKFISNLKLYLEYLLKKNKIHEIHFWQFTKIPDDIAYLESISNVHKTSSHFLEYREIFPIINDNKFIIGIKSTKGGAYILLNEKYEIIININNSEFAIFQNIINNEKIKNKVSKIPDNQYLLYTIQIKDHKLLIYEKDIIIFKYKVEDDKFLSVKIHSERYSDNYWYYEEMKNQNFKLLDTESRTGIDWYEAYKYYLTYEYEILIKMDDDIVFVDVNRFDEYINFMRNNKNINVTIPNLVNHALSVFYNNKYGLLPSEILKPKYINKKSPFDVYDYFKDGDQANIIHNYFINNMYKFVNNNIPPIDINGEKPSICIFGIKRENFISSYNISIIEKIYKKRSENNQIIHFADEIYTYELNNNYFFPKFICVHYHFGAQINKIQNKFLDAYKNITNFYTKIDP